MVSYVQPGWYQGVNLDKSSGLIPSTHLDVETVDALNKLSRPRG